MDAQSTLANGEQGAWTQHTLLVRAELASGSLSPWGWTWPWSRLALESISKPSSLLLESRRVLPRALPRLTLTPPDLWQAPVTPAQSRRRARSSLANSQQPQHHPDTS